MLEKPRLRRPFFETAVKNYIYGDDVLNYAKLADEAARKHDVDVIFIAPYTEIRRVREACESLLVFAPYMDTLAPGRGIADVLPEALVAAGAQGVVLNHVERPMTLAAIRGTIARANGLGMLTLACADSLAEAEAIAHLKVDILNPEPTELIGTTANRDLSFVVDVTKAIRAISPRTLVEQAAGITTAEQVYDMIMAGSDGVGSCSGILSADDPAKTLLSMVAAVRQAAEDRRMTW